MQLKEHGADIEDKVATRPHAAAQSVLGSEGSVKVLLDLAQTSGPDPV